MELTLTCFDRVPLERAISVIEREVATSDQLLSYDALHLSLKGDNPLAYAVEDLRWWLDHALKVLVRAGFLHRLHLGPGELAYTPTLLWEKRDALLNDLRPPRPKERTARKRRRQEARMMRMAQRAEQKAVALRSSCPQERSANG